MPPTTPAGAVIAAGAPTTSESARSSSSLRPPSATRTLYEGAPVPTISISAGPAVAASALHLPAPPLVRDRVRRSGRLNEQNARRGAHRAERGHAPAEEGYVHQRFRPAHSWLLAN